MLSLIKVAHKLRERGHKNIVTYGDVAFAALGRPGKIVVEVLVIALELVFCSGFVIVVGECLQQSFPVLPYWAWVLVSSPILIGLSWIDQLKDLWLVAFVGVGVYIVGVIGGTMYYSTVNLLHPANSHKPEMFVFDTLSLFFGTVVYSMEGINLVMPIESGLRRPSHSYPIIGIGTVLYAAFCCGYGVVAYLAGLGDCDNVIQCLPSSWIRTTIEIALVLALFVLSHRPPFHPSLISVNACHHPLPCHGDVRTGLVFPYHPIADSQVAHTANVPRFNHDRCCRWRRQPFRLVFFSFWVTWSRSRRLYHPSHPRDSNILPRRATLGVLCELVFGIERVNCHGVGHVPISHELDRVESRFGSDVIKYDDYGTSS